MFQLVNVSSNESIALTGVMKTLGRSSECDICIPDDNISRVHSRLDWDGTSWVVVDLGSTNGTFVNGERLEERKLEAGDVLKIGGAELRFIPLVMDDIVRKRITKVT